MEIARMWKLKYSSIHWPAVSGGAREWKLPDVIARKVFAIRISKVWFVLFSWPKADGLRLSWCRLHFEQQSRIQIIPRSSKLRICDIFTYDFPDSEPVNSPDDEQGYSSKANIKCISGILIFNYHIFIVHPALNDNEK